MVAELSKALDELVQLDPDSLSDAELVSELLALRAQLDRLEAVLTRYVDETESR